MAVATTISEFNGAETESTSRTQLNMGSDDSTHIDTAVYPVAASDTVFCYEKWVKMKFTGITNKVDNLQIWKSAGTLDGAASIDTNARTSAYGGAETWASPINTVSTVATETMPATDPGAANLGIAGSLTGDIQIATGESDYLIIQYQPGAAHAAGDIATLTWTFQWDEQ